MKIEEEKWLIVNRIIKQCKSKKELTVKLIKLVPQGILLDPLDCIFIDENKTLEDDCCVFCVYHTLLEKLYSKNKFVKNHLKENWEYWA